MRSGRVAVLVATLMAAPAGAQTLVVDALDGPLDGLVGDPARGRTAVVDREGAHCLLCHALPIREERFHGDLAPSLAGVGSRLTAGQIRLRIVDSSRLNAETIMPPYYRASGLNRVGRAWQGRTVLGAQQVEDIVAYLASLKE